MKPLITLALLASLAPMAAAQTGAGTAHYRVTFEATWSAGTHPGAFPAGAHFSPLIGGTHAAATHIWQTGGMATTGIEVMAETGSPGPLANEITAMINAGTAGEIISGPGAGSPDSVMTTFTVTDAFPAISLVTMIAPSPDWYLGVDSLSLMENDEWVASKTVQLHAYDSGTDSGPDFTSGNQNTNPQDPISLLTTGPFNPNVPFGTFTFTRLASSLEYGLCNAPQGSLALNAPPTLGQNAVFQIHDPVGTSATPAQTLLAFSTIPAPGLPCGIPVPGWGLAGVGATGAQLIGDVLQYQFGPAWNGTPVSTSLAIPSIPALVGIEIFAQGLVISPLPMAGIRFGSTSAIRMTIGA